MVSIPILKKPLDLNQFLKFFSKMNNYFQAKKIQTVFYINYDKKQNGNAIVCHLLNLILLKITNTDTIIFCFTFPFPLFPLSALLC